MNIQRWMIYIPIVGVPQCWISMKHRTNLPISNVILIIWMCFIHFPVLIVAAAIDL
jgi:hypothetical protein